MGDFLRALFGQQPQVPSTQPAGGPIGVSTEGGPMVVQPGAQDLSQATPYPTLARVSPQTGQPYLGPQSTSGAGFYQPDPNRPWGSVWDIAKGIPARAVADIEQIPTGALEYVLGRLAQPGAEVSGQNMEAAARLAALYQTEAGRAGLVGVPRVSQLAGVAQPGELGQLPARVYSPQEREQIAAAQEKEAENELYRRWLGGTLQLPAGMQPNAVRVGPMTFGYPPVYEQPANPAEEPFAPGGVSAPPGKGAVEPGGRAVRNNNPGNIKASAVTLRYPGVVGVDPVEAADGGHFLRFDSPQSGFAAMTTLLRHGYGRLPADAAMRRWSGGGYGAERVGVDPNRTIGSMSDQELTELAQRMAVTGEGSPARLVSAQPAAPVRRVAAAPAAPVRLAAAPAAAPAAPEEEAPLPPEVANAPFADGARAAAGEPGYPSPAPAAGVQAAPPPAPAPVPAPAPAPAPAAPPPAAIAAPAPAPALPAPPPERPAEREGTVGYAPPAPEAGVAPEGPPGRAVVTRPTPISPKGLDDLQKAYGNDPALRAYIDARPGMTNTQVMKDPEVRRLQQAYEDRHTAAVDQSKANISAKAKANLKVLPDAAGDAVAGYLDATRLLRQISRQFSADELREFTGFVQKPAMRTAQAIASFGQYLREQWGIDLGTADVEERYRRFAAYTSLMGQLKSAMFAIGGKQLTGIEKGVVEQFIPTGSEVGGATELVEKGRQFDERARARIDDLLKTHGVGPKARAEILAAEAPREQPQLFPNFDIAPLEERGVYGWKPGQGAPTTTTTLPAPAAGGGVQPPGGGAPPAPSAAAAPPAPTPEAYQPFQGRPVGGISAKEAARGERAPDIAYAERLGLTPEYPGETKEETQARRVLNVSRAELGQPLIERRPAEMPGEPAQFARRLARTVTGPSLSETAAADAAAPPSTTRKIGRAVAATAGPVARVLGAPGATVGTGVEAVTGSRAAGSAAQFATDVLLGARGVRQLASPTVVGQQLRTLEPEMAAAVSRAVQVVNAVPPAGGRLTPAAANAARNITHLLDRAATVTQAGDQANLVRRAVGIADDFLGPGRRVAVIDALRDLATTQRGLADAYRVRMGIQRGVTTAAKWLIPAGVLYNFRQAIGRALIQ